MIDGQYIFLSKAMFDFFEPTQQEAMFHKSLILLLNTVMIYTEMRMLVLQQ